MADTHTSEDGTVQATLTTEESVPERQTYVVTSDDGLFKNGQQYNKGDEVELDSETADRFLKQEEVKNV